MSICDIQRYKKPHLVAQIWGINIPAVYIPAHEFHVCLVQSSYTVSTPAWLIMLRALAFLACAFLVTLAVYGSGDLSSPSDGSHILKGGVAPPKHTLQNNTEAKVNDSTGSGQMWSELVGLLSEEAVENAKLIWESGSNHQMAVASVGLLTCITGVLMAGPVRWRALSFFFFTTVCHVVFVLYLYCISSFLFCWRLRRIDAFASFLWLLVLCLYSVEFYLKTDTPDWLGAIKLGATSLCCLVGFAAAVATRKPTGQRRARGRRSESEQWHFTKPFIRNSCAGCSVGLLFGVLHL